MHSICSGTGALLSVSGTFSAGARFALVDSCTVDCPVTTFWKVVPSCTLRQRAFPIFLSVLVLHHSNVSTLLTAAGTKLCFRLLSKLKISDPDV